MQKQNEVVLKLNSNKNSADILILVNYTKTDLQVNKVKINPQQSQNKISAVDTKLIWPKKIV